MVRQRVSGFLAIVAGAMLSGCATYSQDLDRIAEHYRSSRFDQSLALCRVLEPDAGSLSVSQQARYYYLRGMTDFRLASGQPPATGADSPRARFRAEARYWLGLADAINAKQAGALHEDERTELVATLQQLHADVMGTDEAAAFVAEQAAAQSGTAAPPQAGAAPLPP